MWAPEWEFGMYMVIWDTFGSRPFTTNDITNAVPRDRDQVRVALSRLARKGWLLRLRRGKYLAKPLDRIVTSLRFYSTAQNALRKAGITSPTYIYGSVADLLASKGSDVDLLLVSEGDWDEIERKLPQFHLAFVTPKYLQNLDSFFIYSILRRGVPLISGVEIADASFDPKKLLAEALQTYETAWADGRAYEPQLLDAAGLAAKYILYQKGILPPTSSIGAIFELAKVDENYLGVFRNLEVRPIEDTAKEVIGWARKTR